MDLRITDISEFINCIHDYIIEEFEIIPRDFETRLIVGDRSIAWDTRSIEEFKCPKFNKHLHIHHEEHCPTLICCNEVDIIALKYLNGSIFGPLKYKIISTLHSWLPAATFQAVKVSIKPNCNLIESYFEPSYLFHVLQSPHPITIQYNYYFQRNIVIYESYNLIENNKTIMVRARSRSRSRSPSKSLKKNRKNSKSKQYYYNKPKYERSRRSRSRSRSPMSKKSHKRARSRSKSR